VNQRDHHVAAPLDQPDPIENLVGDRGGEIIQSIDSEPFRRCGPLWRYAARLGTEREHNHTTIGRQADNGEPSCLIESEPGSDRVAGSVIFRTALS
jgi:hypothetical protein